MNNIPQNVVYAQVEQRLINHINEILNTKTLPAYQLECILTSILYDLRQIVEKEYRAALKEYQETENNTESET